MATILQSTILTDFLYPLLLIFFICYAVLEKTSILGKDKQQLNAGVSLIVGLIFVGAVFPKIITAHLIEYMAVAMIIIFVGLVLWGFISGKGSSGFALADGNGFKIHKIFAFLIFGSLLFAILWATGFGDSVLNGMKKFLEVIFGEGTGDFWTNALFVGIVFAAVAIALQWNPFKKMFSGESWIKLG